MRINNYKGHIIDRPIDSIVIEPNQDELQNPIQPHGHETVMEKILSILNNQRSVVPVNDIPVYNKGWNHVAP